MPLISNGPWQSTTVAYPAINTMQQAQASRGVKRRVTRFETMLRELREKGRWVSVGEGYPDFKSVSGEDVVEVFGKWNPLHRGKPKKEAQYLLDAVMYPRSFPLKDYFASVGLAFRIPHIPGRSRAAVRTSVAGLALLDHWAEKSPRFAKFLELYTTKKARKQITGACFDFDMGSMPKFISDIMEKAKAEQTKIDNNKLKEIYDYVNRNGLLDLERRTQSVLYPTNVAPVSSGGLLGVAHSAYTAQQQANLQTAQANWQQSILQKQYMDALNQQTQPNALDLLRRAFKNVEFMGWHHDAAGNSTALVVYFPHSGKTEKVEFQ